MKINPMLKKEIMVSVRGVRLTVLMLIFNIILALIGLLVFAGVLDSASYSGSLDYSATISLYITLVSIQFMLLVFIVPAITASAISGERERQTLDILLSTSLTPSKIIFGKLSSSIISIVLLIISSIPIMSLIFVFGGISILDILGTILFLIFVTIYAAVIGIACSTRFKKTTTATIASYGMILFLGIGTIFLVVMYAGFIGMSGSYSYGAGITSLVLLINPGMSLIKLFLDQVGGGSFYFFEELLDLPEFITKNWLILSLIVQTLFISLLLFLSTRKLNPVKRKRG